MEEKVEAVLRTLALNYLLGYVPNDYQSAQWTQVIGRQYRNGSDSERQKRNSIIGWDCSSPGTTCGYLTAWLLWALGCRNAQKVNREDDQWNNDHPEPRNPLKKGAPTTEIWFETGKGMQKVPYSKNASGKIVADKTFYVPWASKGNALPLLGDIVHLSDPSIDGSDHVLVFLGHYTDSKGNLVWLSADGGQTTLSTKKCTTNGKTHAPAIAQKFNARVMTKDGTRLYFPATTAGGATKKLYVNGWLSLSKLSIWTWSGYPQISQEVMNGIALPVFPPSSQYWNSAVWPYLQQCIVDVYSQWGWRFYSDYKWQEAWYALVGQTAPALWNSVYGVYTNGLNSIYQSMASSNSSMQRASSDENFRSTLRILSDRTQKGETNPEKLFEGLDLSTLMAIQESMSSQTEANAKLNFRKLHLPPPDSPSEQEYSVDNDAENLPRASLEGLVDSGG